MAEILPSVYKVGTATVAANGMTVTGQGTLWVKDVLSGDFFGVHKGLAIQIESVDSNGSLTLANPWPGAAQNAAPYAIMLQSDVARYSEALRQLLVKLSSGNVEALAGLTGAANKFPFFTGAGTMDVGDVSPYARSTVLNKTDRTSLLDALGVSTSLQKLAVVSTNLNLDVTDGWVAGATPITANIPNNTGEWLVHVMAWSNGFHVLQTAYRAFAGGNPRQQFSRQRQNDGSWTAWVEQVQQSFPSVEQGGDAGQLGNKLRLGWFYDNAKGYGGVKAQVDASDLGVMWSDYNCPMLNAQHGYLKFPNGLFIQWGMFPTGGAADLQFNWPVAFAATPWLVTGSAFGEPGTEQMAWSVLFGQYTTTTCVLRRRSITQGGAVAGYGFNVNWVALGRWY